MITNTGVMDYAMFLKIASQIYSIKTIEKVFLHWRGEPTCCTYLSEAIQLLTSHGIKVILFTNGLLLSSKLAKKIIQSNPYAIYFSLESTNSMKYTSIRGRDVYNQIELNIKNAVDIRNDFCSKTKINISTIIMSNNMNEIFMFDNYWKNKVDNIEYHVNTSAPDFLKLNSGQCRWPNFGLFISWDGVVSACCMDVNREYPIGNIDDSNIMDIFNSEASSILRQNLNNCHAIGHCSLCNLFKSM